MKLCVKQEIRI